MVRGTVTEDVVPVRVSFTVPWVAGKERPRFTHGHTYTPKATRVREREVAGLYKLAALAQHKAVPMADAGVPVTLSVIMQHPLPKSTPKRVTSEPFVRKPDIDNAIKLVMDGLNGVAWADDVQVTSVSAVKADRTRDCEASMLVSVEWCDE